jgi:murein DD-endopeptidase MepM/ murein hydrolase activator NlpD
VPPADTPVRSRAETPPALSGRSLRTLRHVRALRTLRRNAAIASSLFGLLLGTGYVIPAYAQTPEPPAPPPLQTVTVSALAAHPVPGRDDYSVTGPPALQWPVSPGTPIADGFGPRVAPCAGCSSYHEGVDFDAGYGTPVHAIAAGVVTETNNPGFSALGVHVTIQHLIDGASVTSVYGHMQTGSMRLNVGDVVTVGQVVGLVGNTGASTGAHLHFEIHLGSTPVNPLPWLHARLG